MGNQTKGLANSGDHKNGLREVRSSQLQCINVNLCWDALVQTDTQIDIVTLMFPNLFNFREELTRPFFTFRPRRLRPHHEEELPPDVPVAPVRRAGSQEDQLQVQRRRGAEPGRPNEVSGRRISEKMGGLR